jgi:hypothetical protein
MTPMSAPIPGWQSARGAASSGCAAHSLRYACMLPSGDNRYRCSKTLQRLDLSAGGELSEKAWQP